MIEPAYYNEFDEYVAEWLRNLIVCGHIAPGDVDTRSIEDVRPDDLRGYTQCHFFAGIGVWSYALRLAGWPDDQPIWTASCPCQPFSAAGQGNGFDDERHLWPALQHLIEQRRPSKIIGEQVASKDADPWLDLVQDDLEAMDYAFGAVAFPSAGVGAPHIRDRTYWVAHANVASSARYGQYSGASQTSSGLRCGSTDRSESGELGDTSGQGLDERERERGILGGTSGTVKGQAAVGAGIHVGGVANPGNRSRQRSQPRAIVGGLPSGVEEDAALRPGPTNGYWSDADWLGCRDGKWRPVEPGTFPLAHGAAARVGRLRAYGNAINAKAAQAFIETVMECRP